MHWIQRYGFEAVQLPEWGHIMLTRGWDNVGCGISYMKKANEPLKLLQSKV